MWLFTLVIISFMEIVYGEYECRNTCNDGGCEYTDKKATTKCKCLNGSNIFRTGKQCESYIDQCKGSKDAINSSYNQVELPCKNNGKCVSILGFSYCDCAIGYHGSFCDFTSDPSNFRF